MNVFFKSLLTAALILSAASAQALTIEISETADFSGLVIVADDSADALGANDDGSVTIIASLGNWILNVVTGVSAPIIGDEYSNQLHLNSVNVSGGSGSLYLRLTDTGFVGGDAPFSVLFGGVGGGVIDFQSYADSSDTPFGQGVLLSDSGILSGAFSGTDSGGILMPTDPYSLSIYATITHTGAGHISSFDYHVTVPEPGTLALLGIGLLGIGLARRRKV